MLLTALPLLASQKTSDPRLVTGVAVAKVASAPFSLLIGALVDRYGRPRRVMILMDFARAALLVALLALLAGKGGLVWLYPLAFLLGAGEVAFVSASVSLVRQITPDDQLDEVNGRLHAASSSGEQLIGPVLGAAVFAAKPLLPFIGDAISFVVSGLVLRSAPDPVVARSDRSLRSVMAEGWRTIRTTGVIWVLTVWIAFLAFFQMMQLSSLVFISKFLEMSSLQFGLFVAGVGIGNVVGGLVAARVAARFSALSVMYVVTIMCGAAHIGAALAGRHAVLVTGALLGEAVAVSIGIVCSMGVRQRSAPPHLIGSVVVTGRMVITGMSMLGGIVAGFLLRSYDVTVLLMLVGIGTVLVGMAGYHPFQRALAAGPILQRNTAPATV